MFYEHQISIIDWLMKCFLTLKTRVMDAENAALPVKEYITY